MPDLSNRRQHEKAIADLLVSIYGSIERAAKANPEAVDWEAYRQQIEQETVALLYLLYLDAAGVMNNSDSFRSIPSFRLDSPSLDNQAQGWARAYASALAREIIDTLREKVGQAIAMFRRGVALAAQRVSDALGSLVGTVTLRGTMQTPQGETVFATDWRDLLDALAAAFAVVFGAARAAVVAVTETTRTITAAEEWVRREFQAATGVLMKRRWRTENDAKVCPICNPLHQKLEADWPATLKAGPPAHPNCRCWLTYEV